MGIEKVIRGRYSCGKTQSTSIGAMALVAADRPVTECLRLDAAMADHHSASAPDMMAATGMNGPRGTQRGVASERRSENNDPILRTSLKYLILPYAPARLGHLRSRR